MNWQLVKEFEFFRVLKSEDLIGTNYAVEKKSLDLLDNLRWDLMFKIYQDHNLFNLDSQVEADMLHMIFYELEKMSKGTC